MCQDLTIVDDVTLGSNELTSSEKAFLEFSINCRRLESDPTAEEPALSFFKEQANKLNEAIESTSILPWEIVHIAQITLEAYALSDLAYEIQKQSRGKKGPAFQSLRPKARDLTRAVGSKFTNWSKKVGKDRAKMIEGIKEGLKGFTQVSNTRYNCVSIKLLTLSCLKIDDAEVLKFASELGESRRVLAEGLGSAIHRRCIK